jgi:hypothetical protein
VPCRPQSARNPASGSIDAARRAGSAHAASAVIAASITAAAKAAASPDETPYRRLDSVRPSAKAPATPAIDPAIVSHSPCYTTSHNTSRGRAPSAMRTLSSCRRWFTANERTL